LAIAVAMFAVAVVGSLMGRWVRNSSLRGTDILIDLETITAAPADTTITTPEAFRK
jgi:hypothetical protein